LVVAALALFVGCAGAGHLAPRAAGRAYGTNDEPVIKTGALTQDEVWSGVIVVSREVLVPKGQTLTLEPDTRVTFETDVEPSSKIVVEGTLYAQGDFQRPVFFAAEERSNLWHGILFETGSVGRITYGQFQLEAKLHLRTDAAQVTFCHFADNSGAAITLEGASPTIEDTVIRNSVVGIRCLRQSSPDVLNNSLIGNVIGVLCEDGSQPNIARNVIANNRQQGILSQGASSPHVNANNLVRNGGYAVQDGGRLTDNFVQGNNGLPPNLVETSLNPQNPQVFGVEEVISTRSSPVPEAGDRRLR
jgi:parallel beta-helix repeat protein